jgi:3,5-epimerase/4-reductase
MTEKIEQEYILLIMNCMKYRGKAFVQQNGWLTNLPKKIPYYHVIGNSELTSPYVFDHVAKILWVKTLDDYVSLPKKVIAALHAVRETFKFKYIFKTDDDQILQNDSFFKNITEEIQRKSTKLKAHYGGQVVDVTIPYISQYYKIHPELPQNIEIHKTEYCSGRFYFLSSEAVTNLVSKREKIESEYLEDYAIGLNLNPIFKKSMIHIQSDEHFKDMEEDYTVECGPTNKVLLFGGNGWIGGKVVKLLENMKSTVKVYIANSRADDIDSIREEINSKQGITHVMSFIGRTHGIYEGNKITTIDYLEKPGKLVENVRDNLYAPISLSMLCKELGIHFTYLGTGCIFDYDDKEHLFGKEENGFNEQSKPNFFGSSYSIVKGFTDQLMHAFDDSVLNIRIRMPITEEVNERNFITKITNYKKICSIPNSMTVLTELLPVLIDMAFNNKTGTINLTNPGLISHNEILEMYKEIIDPAFEWENFTIEEQNTILLSKRSNNYLDTNKLENLYPNVKPIKESVRDILVKMKNNNNNV